MPKTKTAIRLLALLAISCVAGLKLFMLPNSAERASNERPPPVEVLTASPVSVSRPVTEPNPSSSAGAKPAQFEVLSPTSAVIRYQQEELLYSRELRYLDPITGSSLTSTPFNVTRNQGSTSLLATVEIEGTNRPVTLTVGDGGMVYVTLPFSGGVLQGQGRNGLIQLRKARGFNDRVVEVIDAAARAEKEREPQD